MRKMRVHASQHAEGMAIYLNIDGEDYFVMTHRRNNYLFHWLKGEGRTLDEVRQWKPGRDKAQQMLRRSLNHVIKLSEYVLKYEYCEAA